MVYGNEDNITITTEILTMVAILLNAITIGEASSVDPKEDGTLLAIGQALSPDVELEAILTNIIVVPVVGESVVVVGIFALGELWSRRRIKDGGQCVIPCSWSLGGKEATFAFGGFSVGDTEVGVCAVKNVTLDIAVLGLCYGDVIADVELLLIGRVGRLSGLLSTRGQQTEGEGEEMEGFHKGVVLKKERGRPMMADIETQEEGTATKDGRDGDKKGASKVEASVKGKLWCGIEAGTLCFVLLGFDLDG